MKEFLIIVAGWIIWFTFIYPPIDNSMTKNEFEEKVNGNYTTDDMIDSNQKKIFSAENVNISFKNGVYTVHYELYSNCERYYTRTNTCYDNNKKLVDTMDSTGTYSFVDDKLVLKLGNGITRTCKVYISSIDCTKSGGWHYQKIKNT